MTHRVRTTLLAAALVQVAQTPGFMLHDARVPLSFQASHFLLVSVLLAVVAMLAGHRREDRLWAGSLFMLPLILAVWPRSLSEGSMGLGWAGLVAAASLAAVAAYALLPLGRGAPVAAAFAGGILGCGLMLLRQGSISTPAVAAVAACALAVLLAGPRLIHRPPRWVAGPARASLAVALLLVGVVATTQLVPQANQVFAVGREASGPPVVVIVLDTVRADHLRLYGYSRDTMPKLEALMTKEGVWAAQAISNSPFSLPTHASIFTGMYPPNHGAHKPFVADPAPPANDLYPLGPSLPTLAQILSDRGYWTAAVSANYGHLAPDFGLDRGFDHYDARPGSLYGLRRSSPWCMATVIAAQLGRRAKTTPCQLAGADVTYRPATEITDDAVEIIAAAGDQSFFLFLNYFDAHNPFRPPRAYVDRFPGRMNGKEGAELDAMAIEGGYVNLSAEERRHLAATYDSELTYLDDELDRLFDRLREHPSWDEMLVVVLADHGIALGEHDLISHDSQVFAEFIRIPFFAKPGVRALNAPPLATELDGLVQPVDVFATVLQHAGLVVPAGIDGRPWGRGRTEALAWLYRDAALVAGDASFDRELRAITDGTMKVIDSTDENRWLFDARADATEQKNLWGTLVDDQSRLLDLLGPRQEFDPEAISTSQPSEELMKNLRALGYVR